MFTLFANSGLLVSVLLPPPPQAAKNSVEKEMANIVCNFINITPFYPIGYR